MVGAGKTQCKHYFGIFFAASASASSLFTRNWQWKCVRGTETRSCIHAIEFRRTHQHTKVDNIFLSCNFLISLHTHISSNAATKNEKKIVYRLDIGYVSLVYLLAIAKYFSLSSKNHTYTKMPPRVSHLISDRSRLGSVTAPINYVTRFYYGAHILQVIHHFVCLLVGRCSVVDKECDRTMTTSMVHMQTHTRCCFLCAQFVFIAQGHVHEMLFAMHIFWNQTKTPEFPQLTGQSGRWKCHNWWSIGHTKLELYTITESSDNNIKRKPKNDT